MREVNKQGLGILFFFCNIQCSILIYKLRNILINFQINHDFNYSDKHNKKNSNKPNNKFNGQNILSDKMICNKDKFLILKTYIKNHKNSKM